LCFERVERRLHLLVALVRRAIAADIGLHRLDKILGVLSDQIGNACLMADAVVAVTLGASRRRRLAGGDRIVEFRRGCLRRLRRIETGVVGGDLDDRVVAEKLHFLGHVDVGARARLVGFQLQIQVSGPLPGQIGRQPVGGDSIAAVALGARRRGEVLAFCDVDACA